MYQSASASGSPSTKVERRIVEKNRRNQMKFLYSKLNSLLPNHDPKEVLPLPDQIEQAINYIKSLEAKVKMAQDKKENLLVMMGRKNNKRSHDAASSSSNIEITKGSGIMTQTSSPQIEIREIMESSLEIILVTSLDNHFLFSEIIRILNEENVDVVSANSSLSPDHLMRHVLHAEMKPQSLFQFGATKVSERLKRLVYGSASDVEIQKEFWDFEIPGSELPWDF